MGIIRISSNVCTFTVLVKNRTSMKIKIYIYILAVPFLIVGRCKRLLCHYIVTTLLRTPTIYAFPRKRKDIFTAPSPKLGHFIAFIALALRDVYMSIFLLFASEELLKLRCLLPRSTPRPQYDTLISRSNH